MSVPIETCSEVVASVQQGVLCLQLNRPAQKNALSLAMYQSLAQVLSWAREQPEVRVVRMVGSEDSFTAGNDLADFLATGGSANGGISADHPVLHFMQSLRDVPQPLVAEVNGLAVGIGTTLLLHCDFVYAADDAYFQLPFVKLGLCPEFAASTLLAKRVGEAKAREWLLLGECFSAAEAARYGFINGIYPRERLPVEVDSVCQMLTQLPQAALQQSKALLNQVSGWPVEEVVARELEMFAECLASAEAQAVIKKVLKGDA